MTRRRFGYFPIMHVLRAVAAATSSALRGRDLLLWAAGLTFFSALGLVPLLLLALRGVALLFGQDLVVDGARALGGALPEAHDPTGALVGLAEAATTAPWPLLAASLFPASLYGEGLRRALVQAAGEHVTKWTGWAGRIAFLPVLLLAPLLVALPLAFASVVGPLYEAGGWSTVLGVVLSFHLDMVPICATVALVFAFVGPVALPVRTVLAAGVGLGAVLTGFLHGFAVFLAIPVDWAIPYGGLAVPGGVAALGLWLFLLHGLLVFGYRITLSTHDVLTASGAGENNGPAL
ncbi:YhjD/YihY/BrkB family envelope integrity protein [Lentzea sp. CC55]|uniref:YhjD/YihY/BrkB family envelope integrity protein n=1 Tax=Lentzea sp. CC55 TaxID=2884909 RepID=UPI0027DEDB53|nr:YhjD/YihY/BrkB family envelope integrity protein [Lentzea sp. CC55]MCG8922996.1 YihY/virulence factor BrkB family protein [Lentzea sp. CC55]